MADGNRRQGVVRETKGPRAILSGQLAGPSHIRRWLLVALAFLAGFLGPSLLVDIFQNVRSGAEPFLVLRLVELAESACVGFCAVYFPGKVAPSAHLVVAIACALAVAAMAFFSIITLLGSPYIEAGGVPVVIWIIANAIISIAAAGIAVWFTARARHAPGTMNMR